MLKLLRNKKAQNTAEYALMIAIVVGAFSIMQLYIKRGLQARIKDGVNNIPGIIANKSADALVSVARFSQRNRKTSSGSCRNDSKCTRS